MSQQEMVDLVITKRQRVQQYKEMISQEQKWSDKQKLINHQGRIIWQIVELKEMLLRTHNHVI